MLQIDNALYNNQNNTMIMDAFTNDSIVGNVFLDNIQFLKHPDNIIEIDCSDDYKYRPDKLAKQYYGDANYFQIILLANNIGTLFHFVPSKWNNKIKLIKTKVIEDLLKL